MRIGKLITIIKMDTIAAIRLIKMYNKEVEKFLLSRKWFEDDEKIKKNLIIKKEKLRVMIRKSFPNVKTEGMFADIKKTTFGKTDSEEIIKALNVDNDIDFVDDDDVDQFLSSEYRKTVF